MSTLGEIETAVKELPPHQREGLAAFLADQLRQPSVPLAEGQAEGGSS